MFGFSCEQLEKIGGRYVVGFGFFVGCFVGLL